MKSIAAEIHDNAEAINRLWHRISETVEVRHRSQAAREEWKKACEDFHSSYPELIFPGGLQRWEAFLSLDSSEIDSAITFLEVDPRFFRSGYLKQIIWNRLKKPVLAKQQTNRLEGIAAAYLDRRVQREFWHMARYVRARGTPTFWESIEALAKRDVGPSSQKAHWLLLARENFPIRSMIGHELFRAKYQAGYQPNLGFRAHVA